MINKAQTEFRTQDQADSRAFETWYRNEDVQRLIWQIYQDIPADKKYHFLKPYVFYDGLDNEATTLDKLLGACHLLLLEQHLKYLPFILKPGMTQHFCAGFIHVDPDYIYIFDPLGSSLSTNSFRKRFGVSTSNQIADLPVIVSSEKIQNPRYEDKGGFVSCGPLCVEFLDYIMNHPEVVPDSSVPTSSIISPDFGALIESDPEGYRTFIVTIREKHDRYLSALSDELLASEAFQGFYQELTSALVSLGTVAEKDDTVLGFEPSAFTVNYNTENVERIIQQIYQNTSPDMQPLFIRPHVYDSENLNLVDELPARHQILVEKKLNYFPFLFKPKLSQHFYAGLVVRNPKFVYLFIQNGAIQPAPSPNLIAHLGLLSRHFIGNLALQVSPLTLLGLPDNTNICTLLSIEFLDYIMNHEKTFKRPYKFIELLNLHGADYSSYISRLIQKQKSPHPKAPPAFGVVSSSPSSAVTPTHNERIQSGIKNAQKIYFQYYVELSNVVSKLQQEYNDAASSQALKLALSEARIVLNELRLRLPVNAAQNNFLPTMLSHDERLLLRLADLCSHVAHGLIFINQNQVPHEAQMFSYTGDCSGEVFNVSYDFAAHQRYMRHISETALLLPGAGWHALKKALFILAGAMLLLCGLLVVGATIPTSVSSLLTLAGAATLSAGIGFFVGRDAGLASAANKVKMQTTHEIGSLGT